jgi:ferredoxin
MDVPQTHVSQEGRSIRVIVDISKCIASGNCVGVAPEVFDQREEDGIVVLLNENPSEEHLESVRRAADLCPSMAIVVEE